MRRMITSKQQESVRILSELTQGSTYYEEPALPDSLTFSKVDWGNSEFEVNGDGTASCSIWIDAINYEPLTAYDDPGHAPCVYYHLTLIDLPETITDADELIEFIKQGKLTLDNVDEYEPQEWDVGYIYPDEAIVIIEPQENEFNPITLVAIGSDLELIDMPISKMSVSNMTVQDLFGENIHDTKFNHPITEPNQTIYKGTDGIVEIATGNYLAIKRGPLKTLSLNAAPRDTNNSVYQIRVTVQPSYYIGTSDHAWTQGPSEPFLVPRYSSTNVLSYVVGQATFQDNRVIISLHELDGSDVPTLSIVPTQVYYAMKS